MTIADDRPLLESNNDFSVLAPRPIAGPWDRPDCQRIWLGTQLREWRTLAIVPADEELSSYEVASLLMALGLHYGEPIGVADLRNVGLNHVRTSLELVDMHVDRGERVVLATSAITQNLATIALARAADAAVLCVSFGSTSLAVARETINQIGKEHFLGSVLLHQSDKKSQHGKRSTREQEQ